MVKQLEWQQHHHHHHHISFNRPVDQWLVCMPPLQIAELEEMFTGNMAFRDVDVPFEPYDPDAR